MLGKKSLVKEWPRACMNILALPLIVIALTSLQAFLHTSDEDSRISGTSDEDSRIRGTSDQGSVERLQVGLWQPHVS